MKINDIKKLSKEELVKEIENQRSEKEQYYVDIKKGKEKNIKKALNIRKNIARMLSILNSM